MVTQDAGFDVVAPKAFIVPSGANVMTAYNDNMVFVSGAKLYVILGGAVERITSATP